MYIALFLLIFSVLLLLVILHFRKKKIIKKLCHLSMCEKCGMLNELVEPLGYQYDLRQDIFTSTKDAWQKAFGYGEIYDRLAPHFNMIFDCCPVYFDYDGKTWLIELWKGQYGINTGSEIGIYHANTIIPPEKRDSTIFTAVSEDEFPDLKCELLHKKSFVAGLHDRHWWLTIFSMGRFSNPKELTLEVSISFSDLEMRDAFLEALLSCDSHIDSVCVCLSSVRFLFRSSTRKRSLLIKAYRRYVQLKNWIFCQIYCFITRPFVYSCDKLLYLYYYLPFAFRRTLRLKRFRKRRWL